jgi:hypothetical protein
MNTEYMELIAHVTQAIETEDVALLEMMLEANEGTPEEKIIQDLAAAAKTMLEEKWEADNTVEEIKSCLN